MVWPVFAYPDYEKPKKEFVKKWPQEMMAIAANFQTLVLAIESGAKPEQLKSFGFVHSEPLGILALTECGCEKKTKPKALRLYVFVDEVEKEIHVMLLGDKSMQSKDIQLCKTFVQKKLDGREPPS